MRNRILAALAFWFALAVLVLALRSSEEPTKGIEAGSRAAQDVSEAQGPKAGLAEIPSRLAAATPNAKASQPTGQRASVSSTPREQVASLPHGTIRLEDDLGAPLREVTLHLYRRNDAEKALGHQWDRVPVTPLLRTDEQGRVRLPLEQLVAGKSYWISGNPSTFGIGGIYPVILSGVLFTSSVVVQRPAVLSGTVETVLPVEDISLRVLPDTRSSRSAPVEEDGRLLEIHVSPEVIALTFTRGLLSQTLSLSLQPAEVRTDLHVELIEGSWITGLVLDHAGYPMPGAAVAYGWIFKPGQGKRSREMRRFLGGIDRNRTTANAEGRFALPVQKDGQGKSIAAFRERNHPQPIASQVLQVADGETIDVTLREALGRQEVRGQVRFRGLPIPEAKVQVLNPDGEALAETQADTSGRYSLTFDWEGEVCLRVMRTSIENVDPATSRHPKLTSYGPYTTAASQPDAQSHGIDVDLPAGSAVLTRIVDGYPRDLGSGEVTPDSGPGTDGPGNSVVVLLASELVCHGLAPGPVSVRLRSQEWGDVHTRFQMPATGQIAVPIDAGVMARIQVRGIDPQGQPIPLLHREQRRSGGSRPLIGMVEVLRPEGQGDTFLYEAPGSFPVAAGRFFVKLKWNGAVGMSEVVLAEGELREVSVALQPVGSIQISAEPEDLDQLEALELHHESGILARGRREPAAGVYRAWGLLPGKYRARTPDGRSWDLVLPAGGQLKSALPAK